MKNLVLLFIIFSFLDVINAQINDLSVSSDYASFCTNSSSTISTTGSQVGVKYYLRDNSNNAVIDSADGTGSDLSFNSGLLTASETFNVYGVANGAALDFDGINDQVITPYTLSTTSNLTVEAWIYPRGTSFNRFISSYRGSSSLLAGEFVIDNYDVNNNGKGLRVAVSDNATVTGFFMGAVDVLTLNTWNHIAFTFDNGVIKLYVDGLEVADSTANFTTIPASSSNVCLGEDRNVNSIFFDGKMDDVRIWNSSRTAVEIANNMNNCMAGNEAGLEAFFNFEDGTGTTLTDLIA